MDIETRARELLSQTIIGNLGFYGLDGYPRVIPVWFDWTDGEVQVASPPGAYKSRALAADPRAVLTVSTPVAPYHVVSVTGRVSIEVMEEDRRVEVVGRLAERYLGPEGGRRYLESWLRGGHPGPGDLLRLPAERVRYTNVSGE
jgi:PPOX class probable F420-dependent enzyme